MSGFLTADLLRAPVRGLLNVGRSARVLRDIRSAAPGTRRVVLLPARGRLQSSLLRIYNVADELNSLGWHPIVLPWRLGLWHRQRLVGLAQPDVVIMQGARHHLNRPQHFPGQTIAYDMDDADFHLDHLAGPVRDAMPDVATVIAGSRYVADWCRSNGAARADVVWTGTPISDAERPQQNARPKIVAWAQANPETYGEERAIVLKVASALAARHPDMTLRFYGRTPTSDATILDPFHAAGIRTDWQPEMPYGAYLASFDDVAVGLSPICPTTPFSRGKSFGKLLAYLDRKVPVIASDEGDHALFFRPGTGVITNDSHQMVAAADRLLANAGARQAMADAAFADFRDRLSVRAAATHVARVLNDIAGP